MNIDLDITAAALLPRLKHYRDLRIGGEQDWHGNPTDKPKDGPYEPTGIALIDRIATGIGARIMYGGNEAFNAIRSDAYDEHRQISTPDNDKHFIVLPHAKDFDDTEAYAATISHELIHWANARSRKGNAFGATAFDMLIGAFPPGYVEEEMVADIGATMLLSLGGFNPDLDKRAKYLVPYAITLPDGEWEQEFEKAAAVAKENVMWLMQKAGVSVEPDYGSDT